LDNNLPKKIWFLWLQGFDDMPLMVRKCYESWIRHNADWELIFLDENNLADYVNTKRYNEDITSFSDLVRIDLLVKYGGVWVDATCFCMKPLSDWLFGHMATGFFAFDRPAPGRMLSSWFLAAEKYNYISTTLQVKMNEYWKENPDMCLIKRSSWRFLDKLLSKLDNQVWFSGFITKTLKVYPYFWFHYLFEHIYLHDDTFKALWDETPTISADIPHAVLWSHFHDPLGPEIKAHIDNKVAPLYKLIRKYDIQHAHRPGTTLEYLLNSQ